MKGFANTVKDITVSICLVWGKKGGEGSSSHFSKTDLLLSNFTALDARVYSLAP
jgi:hypothetical protein